MKLPNLFIAGFPKCGTTSTAWTLHKLFAARLPDEGEDEACWAYSQKEPVFMMRGEEERREWCDRKYGDERYRLDATPDYILDEGALSRIGELDAKVIILMRHPVARAISWWNHHQKLMITEDLEVHWRLPRKLTMDQLISDNLSGGKYPNKMISGGEYHKGIEMLLEHNDAANIHFAFLEDLIDNHVDYYERIFSFLDTPFPDGIASIHADINQGVALTLPEKNILRLEEHYNETILKTEKLVGRVPPSWKNNKLK